MPPLSTFAQKSEAQDWGRATNAFATGTSSIAEDALGRFVATYTNSLHRTNAILLQAQARIELSNYTGALSLLESAQPGALAPDFVFWEAKAYYEQGRYTNSIERCNSLITNYPDAPELPLRATLLEGEAFSKLSQWTNITALFSGSNGVFQMAARSRPSDPVIVNGYFLLGEAFFNQRQYGAAEDVIGKMSTDGLAPNQLWQRQYLLCQVLLQKGEVGEAVAGISNLQGLMNPGGQTVDTMFLSGDVLARAGQTNEAIEAYTNNLATNYSAAANRQAFRKIIALKRQQNEASNTMQWLADFIKQRPGDPVLDLAYYHLGDLQLRGYFAPTETATNGPPPPDTNLLSTAMTNLGMVTHDFTNSEVIGNAFLDLGWCNWTLKNFPAARNHFSLAAGNLSNSVDQAVAIFKLADSDYRETKYAAAANNYERLLQEYAGMEIVTNSLFEPALYQLVQANIQLGDLPGATNAADHLLHWFPTTSAGEKSLLLIGEDLSGRKTDYQMARTVFSELLEKYPNTSLGPEIQLAIARTYEEEGNWTNALESYAAMQTNASFPTNLLAELDYSYALACWHANQESNALAGMTNVVFHYPGDNHAPLAKIWIGNFQFDHHLYAEADLTFQELILRFPNAGTLVWEAGLLEGKAKSKNQDLPGAADEFYRLANDTNAPAQYRTQAFFQRGYTLFQEFQEGKTNKGALTPAIQALEQVAPQTNSAPTNAMAALAAGQLGNCYFALSNYSSAALWYNTELLDTNDTPDDISARGEAEFGLGLIAEQQHEPTEALRHYAAILFDPDPAHLDPIWLKNAGVQAAAIYEAQTNSAAAIKVYRKVQSVVPSLGDLMEKHISRLDNR
jgi:TolA-binding protein